LTFSSRWLGVLVAALLYTLDNNAGMSDRLPATGIRRTIPGNRTVSFANGIKGRLTAFDGAIVDDVGIKVVVDARECGFDLEILVSIDVVTKKLNVD
jgi:hypothetical protein